MRLSDSSPRPGTSTRTWSRPLKALRLWTLAFSTTPSFSRNQPTTTSSRLSDIDQQVYPSPSGGPGTYRWNAPPDSGMISIARPRPSRDSELLMVPGRTRDHDGGSGQRHDHHAEVDDSAPPGTPALVLLDVFLYLPDALFDPGICHETIISIPRARN